MSRLTCMENVQTVSIRFPMSHDIAVNASRDLVFLNRLLRIFRTALPCAPWPPPSDNMLNTVDSWVPQRRGNSLDSLRLACRDATGIDADQHPKRNRDAPLRSLKRSLSSGPERKPVGPIARLSGFGTEARDMARHGPDMRLKFKEG